MRRIPLISPQRMVMVGALVLLAIALPAAAFFRPAGPVPADTESDWQAGAMEYLSEIGFGVEYGSAASVLHKWTQDVRIKVHGSPTEVDRQTIEQVVAELNSMVGEINLVLVDEAANLDVYFSPEYQFSDIEPTVVPEAELSATPGAAEKHTKSGGPARFLEVLTDWR